MISSHLHLPLLIHSPCCPVLLGGFWEEVACPLPASPPCWWGCQCYLLGSRGKTAWGPPPTPQAACVPLLKSQLPEGALFHRATFIPGLRPPLPSLDTSVTGVPGIPTLGSSTSRGVPALRLRLCGLSRPKLLCALSCPLHCSTDPLPQT